MRMHGLGWLLKALSALKIRSTNSKKEIHHVLLFDAFLEL